MYQVMRVVGAEWRWPTFRLRAENDQHEAWLTFPAIGGFEVLRQAETDEEGIVGKKVVLYVEGRDVRYMGPVEE